MAAAGTRTRRLALAVVGSSVLAVCLAGCAGGTDDRVQPRPVAPTATTGADSGPEDQPSATGTPEVTEPADPSTEPADLLGSAIAAAEPVATQAVVGYTTWSYADPDWQTWVDRQRPFTTDGFRHTMAELFTEDSGDTWAADVVESRLTSTTEVRRIDVASSPSPRLDRVVFTVDSVQSITAEDGSTQDRPRVTQEVTVVLGGGQWLTEDIRVAVPDASGVVPE